VLIHTPVKMAMKAQSQVFFRKGVRVGEIAMVKAIRKCREKSGESALSSQQGRGQVYRVFPYKIQGLSLSQDSTYRPFSNPNQIKHSHMKNPIIAYSGWVLILGALAFYLSGIYQAIDLTWQNRPLPDSAKNLDYLFSSVSSIQAMLLTNLGVLLGISIKAPDSAVAQHLLLSKGTPPNGLASVKDPLQLREKIQLFALIVYLISLIGCLMAWIHVDFETRSTHVIATVPESAKMFIGVVLAYLSIALTPATPTSSSNTQNS
jgi:hypothetical protein